MKIILDTNVLLSGLAAPDGTPGRIMAAWNEARFDVAMSTYQLDEIARVLAYPKINKRLHWDAWKIDQFIRQLYIRCEVIALPRLTVSVPRDPADTRILKTLIAARADVLVTGDNDLLVLRDRYAIQKPAEFVRRL